MTKKNLAISKNNLSKNPNKNLYLDNSFYLNLGKISDDFNEKLNIVKHYSNSATSISYHEEKCKKYFKF